MKNPSIHISIAFNDAILPVIQCEDGHERVPLQPIAKVTAFLHSLNPDMVRSQGQNTDKYKNAEDFHRLWGECKDSPGYNKKAWVELQRQLEAAQLI